MTRRELDILSILWKEGSGTVAEIQDELSDDSGYTTVLKMLQILERKELVRHEREGRAYRYFPCLDPAEVGGDALGKIVDKVYQGSAEAAMEELLQRHPPTPDEAERIRRLIDEAVGG